MPLCNRKYRENTDRSVLYVAVHFSTTYIIIWRTQQISIKIGIPWQSIPFFGMALESYIWSTLSIGI